MKKKAYLNKWISLTGRGTFKTVPFLLSFILFLVPAACGAENTELVIRNQDTGELYLAKEVSPGTELTVSWVHSVEKTKWQDHLEVNEEGELMLTETRFESYGAGVDHESKEDVEFNNGNIVYKNLNKKLECYRWIHSHEAKHTIAFNDSYQLSKEIPHHEAVEICIESR